MAAFLLSWEDAMLKPHWYLIDTDWFAQLPDAPQLSDDDRTAIGLLAQLIGDELSFDPAKTVATTHVLLIAVEHLSDSMTHAADIHDLTELARLLCGLNLAQAHLTQTIQRIAEHVNNRSFNGLTSVPAAVVRTLAANLYAAGADGESFAGHLKGAHLVLRTTTRQ